ncbi:MAG TPA: 5'-methylthioadenosine/S-adenosylhomocysteine nucleosidase [Ktedonobacteraceae bacterium]|nr:5'-methylthioadenosine/S-adenosylhomocysteine nucleosidase [Ktedonobacteraceae bacterium]
MRSALHWAAFLSQNTLIMPTSDLVQSPVAIDLLEDLNLLVATENLYFVGPSTELEVLQNLHLAQFDSTSLYKEWAHASFRRRLKPFARSFHIRTLNTTTNIKTRWNSDIIALAGSTIIPCHLPIEQMLQARLLLPSKVPPEDYESALATIPDRLENHAFLWGVVENLGLFDYNTSPTARVHYELALAWYWVMSYIEEFKTNLIGRIPQVGYVDCGLLRTNPEVLVDLVAYERAASFLGLLHAFRELTLADIVRLRAEPKVILLRDTLLKQLSHLANSDKVSPSQTAIVVRACDLVKNSILSANNAYQAVIIAAEQVARLNYPEQASLAFISESVDNSQQTKKEARLSTEMRGRDRKGQPFRYTIAVIVALSEELEVLLAAVKATVGSVLIEEDSETGLLFYKTERQTTRGIDIQFIFAFVGKGQERAAAGTVMVINKYQPSIVVNIGIAGALSTDVMVGDVVIGDQVISYYANTKAVAHGKNGFKLLPGGDPLRSDSFLVYRAQQLKVLASEAFVAAQKRLLQQVSPDLISSMSDFRFEIYTGPIASGPVVGAATAFKSWLRRWKRDYLAVEMESSGVAVAAEFTGMFRRVRFLALRGISDSADEDKSRLEETTKGVVRHLALFAALEMLIVLIDTLPLQAFSNTNDLY